MLKESFAARFKDLAAAYGKIEMARVSGYETRYADPAQWHQWATSAASLVQLAFGEQSVQVAHFTVLAEKVTGSRAEYECNAVFGVFNGAKSDFEAGFALSPDIRVSGEVLGDFVRLAKEALGEGHKNVAAVLACAALEDALKRFASANEIDVNEKTMQEVVNALKGARLVGGAQKTLLDTMPKLRNAALHADWGKLSEPEVSSVIGFVEQFLLTKFSEA